MTRPDSAWVDCDMGNPLGSFSVQFIDSDGEHVGTEARFATFVQARDHAERADTVNGDLYSEDVEAFWRLYGGPGAPW